MVFAMVLNALKPVFSATLYHCASFVYATSIVLAVLNIFQSLCVRLNAIFILDIDRIIFCFCCIDCASNSSGLCRADIYFLPIVVFLSHRC